MPKVAVLAHFQAADSHRDTFVPGDVGDLLVQNMMAERISRKLIRMLPPTSVFPVATCFPINEGYVPGTLPPAEVENVKFVPPEIPEFGNIPRAHHLPRYRETYGDAQLEVSLGWTPNFLSSDLPA